MTTAVPPARPSPDSGPDLLTRTNTIPSTGTRITQSLRAQFLLRKGRPPHAAADGATSTGGNGVQPAPEDIGPETVQDIVDSAFRRPALKGLDPFRFEYDTLKSYEVNLEDVKARSLVRTEAQRLVNIVQNPDTPLVLERCKGLGQGNLDGYKALKIFSRCLIIIKLICQADNYGIGYLNGLEGHTKKVYHDYLQRIFNDLGEIVLASEDMKEIWPRHSEFIEDAGALLDLMTGCIARYLVQVAHGKGWRNHQLGALAKFTAKAKVLLGKGITESMKVFEKNASEVNKEVDKRPTADHQKEPPGVQRGKLVRADIDIFRTDRDKILEHLRIQERNRSGIMRLLDYVLISFLPGDRHPGFGITEYEICGVVMDTGFHDFQTLLYQDRDFEYASSSDPDCLNCAHSAFRMLDVLGDHFAREHMKRPPRPDPLPSTTKTTLEWYYSPHDSPAPRHSKSEMKEMPKRRCELVSMGEIISVMIPLALASPVVWTMCKDLVETFYRTLDPEEVVRPFPSRPFNAFARLYTNDFEAARQQRLQPGVLQLADAVATGLFSRTSLLDTSVGSMTKNAGSEGGWTLYKRSESREDREKKLAEAHGIMNTWVYTESAVVVPCGLYVWSVILGVLTLVAGGLAIGLTVQDRIAGVDPFNITMYAWALSALTLLLCKARLVEDWTWNDFLHQRVKCRSVSELHAVTGIHEQLILAKLLYDERDSILRTRGPFNAVFLNKSDAGFAIDVPLKNKTMLLSGLVLIKVEIALGYALVCLDVRRGTELRTVNHREVNSDKPWLMCPRMDRLALATVAKAYGDEPAPPPRFPLKTGPLEWRRVEGIYNVLDAEFT
ncbi:hypothetical protein VTJ83DRAFT_6040 [Remersonia thermophila]|uniref:SMODS and SLOG-associating 2TM effector domain-containing protein n=1 Tax=Remersonia thermophila TaxID=72144 RepID=A0ABR4D8M1_9PEZI